MTQIPNDILTRNPLMKPEWMSMIHKLVEHDHAPKWNTVCGDRITYEDEKFIRTFENNLYNHRTKQENYPNESILNWIDSLKDRVLLFKKNLQGINLKTNFHSIPFMNREDLVLRMDEIIPIDESLDRLVVNPTSGTTGQPIKSPSHPKAVGCYDPLIQFALMRNGLNAKYDHTTVAGIQVCAQKNTITYATVHSLLNGAGFAKINLDRKDWKKDESSKIYLGDMSPIFLSGDPFSFSELIKQNIPYKPKSILTTAMMLNPEMRKIFESYFNCPIVDFYSMNETGPIGYSCPIHKDMLHILPNDIFVETIDDAGSPLKDEKIGEIVISGGRNPYIPLLRYKTGDRGRLIYTPCECGDPNPRIAELDGRKAVLFRTPNGDLINPIDISRILKQYPIVQFQFTQQKDYSCELNFKIFTNPPITNEMEIIQRIETLFNDQINLKVKYDLDLSGKKVVQFVSNSNSQ